MYLLDTDHITALDRGGEEGERLRTRLAHVPPEEAVVSTDFSQVPALRVEDWMR